MPRILVADDNSNIHRTVALALKDTGVEVIAVGNGEAAVRKIAEIKPDLVLADIFMPVRSGYEVCEFVKQDPRFADVPVVLLIGAFDPFDEREAQRVRADAILKKPFVPPDSLLRTVTDLLAQSASRVSQAPVAATVAQVAQTERPSTPTPAPPTETQVTEYMDAAPEEFEPAKARLEWNSDDQPVAFGTLLETPAAEAKTETADEAVMTARRDPNLGEPAFWAPKVQAEGEQAQAETEEAQAEPSTEFVDEEQWHPDAGLAELPAQTEAASDIAQEEAPLELLKSAPELPETALPVNTFLETPVESLEESPLQLPDFPSLDLPPAESFAPLANLDSFSKPPALIAVPSPGTTEEPQEMPPAKEDTSHDLKGFSWAAPNHPAEAPTETASESDSAAELETTPEQEAIDAATPGLATLAPFLASLTSAASTRVPEELREPFEFEAIPALPGDLQSDLIEPEPAGLLDAPVGSRLDPAVIEAIAQRVIERMQPKIIELVTRELLRPAVEALVQRELEKK